MMPLFLSHYERTLDHRPAAAEATTLSKSFLRIDLCVFEPTERIQAAAISRHRRHCREKKSITPLMTLKLSLVKKTELAVLSGNRLEGSASKPLLQRLRLV